jgi:dienelactone hydrolase
MTAENDNPDSYLFGLLDPERYAYTGHSMGGGGALYAASEDAGTDAVVPLAGWSDSPDLSALTTPALVVTCTGDDVDSSDAPNAVHSEVFYASLAGEKATAKFDGPHICPMTGQPRTALIGRYVLAFLKHAVDDDYRYTNFLCQPADDGETNPAPAPDPNVEPVEFASTIC